ncbi:MAG TPA: alanine racemase [Verrucomicrobiae bacterium]|nr:alanine racemase [Verrucomicrobiae bacterium]HTZ55607.1 alanine racemase [Candidatus Acidoferrum sp.]
MIGTLRISTTALRHNARQLRELVGAQHAAFVVKANAYGHGIVDTALAVEGLAVKLCVYNVDEALELRDGGITAPILIMGPIPPERLDDAMACNAEVALWDIKAFARDLSLAALRAQTRARVHVKVNTGLNRLGLQPGELPDAVEAYGRANGLEIAGIFSHLAAAEELDSPYTMLQLERFNQAYQQAEPIVAARGFTPIRHIAASAAAMLWPQTRLDMSRFGIALYGLWPSAATKEAMNGGKLPLQPALSYESQLVVVRTIDAGEAVGYGITYHAPRRMQIGVVPLGYADGIPRALSNKGSVLVDGIRCAIIGRVAMNMFFVDLSHVPSPHVGSKVTLIGRDGPQEISADEWGLWTDSINYEIVSRLPSTLARTYIEEG